MMGVLAALKGMIEAFGPAAGLSVQQAVVVEAARAAVLLAERETYDG